MSSPIRTSADYQKEARERYRVAQSETSANLRQAKVASSNREATAKLCEALRLSQNALRFIEEVNLWANADLSIEIAELSTKVDDLTSLVNDLVQQEFPL